MKGLPAVILIQVIIPDKLTSSILVVAPFSVSILDVAPQCPHSVSGLVVVLHSASVLELVI